MLSISPVKSVLLAISLKRPFLGLSCHNLNINLIGEFILGIKKPAISGFLLF
jgi:hypothetical protein